MYFVSKDENDNGNHWIHALDITTGVERPHSPMIITATVTGNGAGDYTQLQQSNASFLAIFFFTIVLVSTMQAAPEDLSRFLRRIRTVDQECYF
jgi:hypothetical protein